MSVCNRLRQVFVEKLHVEPPDDDADLIEGGVLDSFLFVELLLHIEQSFGLKITLGSVEIESFRSIGRITNFIEASSHRPGAQMS